MSVGCCFKRKFTCSGKIDYPYKGNYNQAMIENKVSNLNSINLKLTKATKNHVGFNGKLPLKGIESIQAGFGVESLTFTGCGGYKTQTLKPVR